MLKLGDAPNMRLAMTASNGGPRSRVGAQRWLASAVLEEDAGS